MRNIFYWGVIGCYGMLLLLLPGISCAKIVLISLQKCGTHLALNCLTALMHYRETWCTSQQKSFTHEQEKADLLEGHFRYSPEVVNFIEKNICSLYRRFMKWSHHPNVYTTSFEKLIGPQGWGSKEEQLQEILNSAQHVDHPITKEQAEKITKNLFGSTWTFRKGQAGSWREEPHITEQHKKLFKKIMGPLLIDLGYETDLNW